MAIKVLPEGSMEGSGGMDVAQNQGLYKGAPPVSDELLSLQNPGFMEEMNRMLAAAIDRKRMELERMGISTEMMSDEEIRSFDMPMNDDVLVDQMIRDAEVNTPGIMEATGVTPQKFGPMSDRELEMLNQTSAPQQALPAAAQTMQNMAQRLGMRNKGSMSDRELGVLQNLMRGQ